MKNIIGVIPARYKSTRFPGKPLVLIKNKPLVIRVWERAMRSRLLSSVIIATDDKRIAETALRYGALVEMTSKSCNSGSDRVREVARRHPEAMAFINIQGDEPLISPETIDAVAGVFYYQKKKNNPIECATAVYPTNKKKSNLIDSPDTAKVIIDKNNFALYFSRALIPASARHSKIKQDEIVYLKHIGIYGYTRDFLVNKMKKLKPCLLEQVEQLEQLRFLWNGIKIKCVRAVSDSIGVDTPEDIKNIEKLLSD